MFKNQDHTYFHHLPTVREELSFAEMEYLVRAVKSPLVADDSWVSCVPESPLPDLSEDDIADFIRKVRLLHLDWGSHVSEHEACGLPTVMSSDGQHAYPCMVFVPVERFGYTESGMRCGFGSAYVGFDEVFGSARVSALLRLASQTSDLDDAGGECLKSLRDCCSVPVGGVTSAEVPWHLILESRIWYGVRSSRFERAALLASVLRNMTAFGIDETSASSAAERWVEDSSAECDVSDDVVVRDYRFDDDSDRAVLELSGIMERVFDVRRFENQADLASALAWVNADPDAFDVVCSALAG
ncbi:Uncharacterised protein [Slackia heliotrinireducens]|uniref:Uncharacterized protein n=1 Tax=Slackia heliotrinireducens (strain ATCC 29202 / DSM 20476 / NCTC 11029 / RHS 1) TaxID=471855 RepID=C7N594_SLAHD|nr:hypothetical protein [Slackia heliotrinireducens]ACV22079.1 hypothetical protein Shel_10440 [Slackia heliotrinireducens DSM 20476]VEH00062.1 Uncharacterised protein [Slackia heliotrinireducens]